MKVAFLPVSLSQVRKRTHQGEDGLGMTTQMRGLARLSLSCSSRCFQPVYLEEMHLSGRCHELEVYACYCVSLMVRLGLVLGKHGSIFLESVPCQEIKEQVCSLNPRGLLRPFRLMLSFILQLFKLRPRDRDCSSHQPSRSIASDFLTLCTTWYYSLICLFRHLRF